ncbi:histidine protein methyltransferase 1 homolog [Babesia caballi]|uniref:protein-histidine N-methyltransferase n=1 Tax=Babesia caballi TaxID=5871 RepID=A0AAV4LXX6_BABCB|nr:histidine protein methyltransferase 1 homolog [Babesia caballi]
MESHVGFSVAHLLSGYREHRLDLATCQVSTVRKGSGPYRTGPAEGTSDSGEGPVLTVRLAPLPLSKRASTVKVGEYEGGFAIWESTWFLAGFLQTELQRREGVFAVDLGCGNGVCGVLALQKGYNVLFQDLNWEVLEESVTPNCLLNTHFQALKDFREARMRIDADIAGSASDHSKPTQNRKLSKAAMASSTSQTAGDGMIDCEVTLTVREADAHRHAVVTDIIIGGDSLYAGMCDLSNAERPASMNANEGSIELLACTWEEMAELSATVIPHRRQKCDLIVASECLYRTECYPAIAAVLEAYLTPSSGVAYIATKRLYFGMDGGSFEFVEYINSRNRGDPSRLKASICKSHTPPGSANIIDIIYVTCAT